MLKTDKNTSRHTKVFLYAALFFFLSLYIISSPLNIMLLTLLFCTLHEAAHIICAKALGCKVKVLKFSFFGLCPELECGSPLSCLAIYSAGVTLNLIFAILSLFFLHNGYSSLVFDIFIINALLFLFNIIPTPFSDGNGIMRAALSFFLSERAVYVICTALNILFSFVLFVFFSYRFFVLGTGVFSFFCSVVFLLEAISEIGRG